MPTPGRTLRSIAVVMSNLTAAASLGACARASFEADYAPPPATVAQAAPSVDTRAPMGRLALGGKGRGDGGGGVYDALKDASKKEGAADPEDAPAKPEPRLVHYDGSVRVRATDPRKTLEQAATMALDMGGYVEQQTDAMVTLRVPVEHVREAFASLLTLGDVLSRSLTAQDVTDAFTASELRLKTLRASRDRLIALLATVKEEQERLQILGEIRRLTEEVDTLDLQVKTLAKLAAYSRLTLEAVPRETRGTSHSDSLAAFRWVDDLSPFRRDTAAHGSLLKLAAPKEMVVLDDHSHWIAESADGAVIWTSKRKNAPQGTSEFWSSAIAERLTTDFASTERSTIGAYQFASFVDGGDAHYRYMVGVKANGDDLDVIEIYYPTPEHEKRYAPAVTAVIAGGAS